MGVNYRNDQEYAEISLSGTLVLYDKNICLVLEVFRNSVNDKVGARILINKEGKTEEISVPLEDLDLKPFPLGYVDFQGKSYYLCRVPSRQWRQGLSERNFCAVSEGQECGRPRGLLLRHIMKRMEDEYPNQREVRRDILTGRISSGALSRDFAITSSDTRGKKGGLLIYYLEYRSYAIGKVKKGVVTLKDGWDDPLIKEKIEGLGLGLEK